jgi:hypothetical protein
MPLSCERLESVLKSRAEGFSRFFSFAALFVSVVGVAIPP